MNFENLSSETLAARIVAFRALGLDRDLAILAMKELMIRRQAGEQFPFESWIEEELKKIPKLEKNNISSFIDIVKNTNEQFNKRNK